MEDKWKRPGSITFLLAGLVLVVVVGCSVQLIPCSRPYCDDDWQQTKSNLTVARTGGYHPNVAKRYESELKHWRCSDCGGGRVSVFRWAYRSLYRLTGEGGSVR